MLIRLPGSGLRCKKIFLALQSQVCELFSAGETHGLCIEIVNGPARLTSRGLASRGCFTR